MPADTPPTPTTPTNPTAAGDPARLDAGAASDQSAGALVAGSMAAGSLGSAIRMYRRRSGLSQSELATRAGCANSYLSAIENGKRRGPAPPLLDRLESCLGLETGTLARIADRDRSPDSVRSELRSAHAQSAMLARLRSIVAEGGLDDAHRAGTIQRMLAELGGTPREEPAQPGAAQSVAPPTGSASALPLQTRMTPLPSLPFEVPLINKVKAGYPTEFTDLGYPARVADDYVRCPDLADPDAFAARVVGDSMAPDYREGDIVVFSPLRDITDGDDCFARLATGDESTFKRVYFEGEQGSERIRLQPINSRYAPRTYDREEVAGLYRAVQVMRAL